EVVEQAPAQQADPAIARAEVLARAIGDSALAHPGDDVLIDDVAGDPLAGVRIGRRAAPRGDRFLDIRLGFLRHADERPDHRKRVLVVDRHAPFEVLAEKETVRPEADAADRPERIALVGVSADASVTE